MFCPKCGKINPDDSQNCSGCNAPLKEETDIIVPKKNNTLKIVLAVLLVLVIAVIVIAFFSGCSAGDINPKENVLF